MASTCPIDANTLSLTQSDGLEAMACAACGGAWLSANNAGALLSRLSAAAPLQEKFFDKVRQEGRDSKLACLECAAAMRTVAHRKVEIDVCQDCGGIWFDGGELQRFRQSGVAKPARGATVAAGAAVVAGAAAVAAAGAAGAAGAGALGSGQPPPQSESLVSGVGDFVGEIAIDGVVDVVGDVAGSVFSAILESIFS